MENVLGLKNPAFTVSVLLIVWSFYLVSLAVYRLEGPVYLACKRSAREIWYGMMAPRRQQSSCSSTN